MRDGGAFGNVIVAAQHQRRAVLAGAGNVGVAEDVAGAVDARAFAVPDANHAVVARLAERVMNLAAENGCSGQIFVDTGHEMDAVLVKQGPHAREGHVVAAQRRAFVSGDEGGRVQTGAAVAAHLVHGQTHQRLDAGEVDSAVFLFVFGIELHLTAESATALYNAWQRGRAAGARAMGRLPVGRGGTKLCREHLRKPRAPTRSRIWHRAARTFRPTSPIGSPSCGRCAGSVWI